MDMDEDDRADEMGAQFGHKMIGTWSYHTALNDITNWGRVGNACRLLSALLRIWSMAKVQMKALDSDPLVHNHIKQVCDNIQQAFKAPSSQKAKAPGSAVERAATGSKEASSSSDGKVSESRLRRLGKKLSIPLLKKAGIDVPSKANRNDVADMLVASWKSGKLNITAKQLQEIESGKQKAE